MKSYMSYRLSQLAFTIVIACVAWRFCRAGRTSGVAAKFAREARENERRSREKKKVAPAPISWRFFCPRPPLLLSNQNRHATQATIVIAKLIFVSDEIRAKLPQKPNFESKKIQILGENGINFKLKHRKAHNSILSGRFVVVSGRVCMYVPYPAL